MDEIEEAAADEARGVVAEQRRPFAVGGEHAAAAVVAQDEIADRAGERRVAFGAADGVAMAGAAGARGGDQMQRRIGGGGRGDSGEPQTAERRRGGAEPPAVARSAISSSSAIASRLAKRSSEAELAIAASSGSSMQPAEAHFRRQPRADDDDADEQRQREQRNELRLDQIAGAGEVDDRRQRQQQPGEGADPPQRIRADGGEIARNQRGDEDDRRQPGEDEQLVASAIGAQARASGWTRAAKRRRALANGNSNLRLRGPRGSDSTPGGRSQPPLKSTLR